MMNFQMLLTAILLGGIATNAVGQPATHEKKEIVIAYRLQEWQTMRFDDIAKAQQHADAVKRLGVEIRDDQQSVRAEVTYRSASWKPLRVDSDELAHQWEDWLRSSGFETLHGHSPDHDDHAHHEEHDKDHNQEHGDVVLYRKASWTTQHFNEPTAAAEFVTLAQALGCGVQKADNEAVTDVHFRCVEWTAVEFPDHKAAEAWEKWFTSVGFEVQHEDEHKDQ